MLLYDNKSFLGLLLERRGSVFYRPGSLLLVKIQDKGARASTKWHTADSRGEVADRYICLFYLVYLSSTADGPSLPGCVGYKRDARNDFSIHHFAAVSLSFQCFCKVRGNRLVRARRWTPVLAG